jgi:hypothetical protein
MGFLRLSTAIVLGLGLVACDNDETGPSSTVTVRITDSPFSDAQAVLVTFSDLAAQRSGDSGFTDIPFSPESATRTCDLKRLQDVEDVLGAGALPEGHYTRIRVTISSATLYFDAASTGSPCSATIAPPAGASATIAVPTSEVIINQEFDVSQNDGTAITLDFEGEPSIQQMADGSFTMTPVISVVNVE